MFSIFNMTSLINLIFIHISFNSYEEMTQETDEGKERNEEICNYIEASRALSMQDLVKSVGR